MFNIYLKDLIYAKKNYKECRKETTYNPLLC